MAQRFTEDGLPIIHCYTDFDGIARRVIATPNGLRDQRKWRRRAGWTDGTALSDEEAARLLSLTGHQLSVRVEQA